MNHKERMLAELPYVAAKDGLDEERKHCKHFIHQFNQLDVDQDDYKNELIHKIIGSMGENSWFEAPFHCDYGYNIEVGKNFFANYNCIMLDVSKIKIGDNVMFGPNVLVCTAGHPLHPETRATFYEYGIGITIGDNVWVGGNVTINPCVHIGNNVVIGAGSVVTKDIPDNMVAVGVPCKPIREITENDRFYYFKDRKFDINPFEE